MTRISPKEEMRSWLEANPGKTERDWLVEECCTSDVQRMALNELLDYCNNSNIPYLICYDIHIKSELKKFWKDNNYDLAPLDDILKHSTEDIFFDLYFPHKGWFINIGSEIEDAKKHLHNVPGPWYKELEFLSGPVLFEYLGEDIAFEHRLLQIYFSNYLMSKYTFPQYDPKDFSRAGQNLPDGKQGLFFPGITM